MCMVLVALWAVSAMFSIEAAAEKGRNEPTEKQVWQFLPLFGERGYFRLSQKLRCFLDASTQIFMRVCPFVSPLFGQLVAHFFYTAIK